MIRMLGLAVAGLMATSAVAAPPIASWLTSDPGDPYGTASIQEGRFTAAQKRLTAAYARGDRSVELMLNLAALRARQGQGSGAQDLYRAVLSQPDIGLVTVTGTSSSHDVARRGLAGAITTASR